MKIFSLEKINIALTERFIKTAPKNTATYLLAIHAKNKERYPYKGSDLSAWVIGYKDDDMLEIQHRKLSIKRTGSYLTNGNFYKNEKTTPAPLIIFHKKKRGINPLNKRLMRDLYVELNQIYCKFNDTLPTLTDKEAISQHKMDYQKKIECLAIGFFSNLERISYPSTAIEGIVLDRFFIGHKQGKLFIKDSTLSGNQDDSFLTKEPFSPSSIPSNLAAKASELLFNYNNTLQSKYDKKPTKTDKERLEKEINLVSSLHGALFSRDHSELQSALQTLKKSNEEKYSKYRYKLLSKFHYKPKRVRLTESIEALTQPRPFMYK